MIKVTKRGKKAWVTFTMPASSAVTGLAIKGSWNGWQAEAMKRKKSGEFYITKVLPVGERHEYGYVPDGDGWLADASQPCVETPFGSRNSVLEL
jgi:hypothetical protein